MKSQPVPPHEMSYPPGNVTSLSQARPSERRIFQHLSRVARVSLCLFVIAALGGLSCLITSTPDFIEPTRTPPFLTQLTPAPYQVIPLRSVPAGTGTYLEPPIGFVVVSEDLQSPPLQAILLLDFRGFDSAQPPLRLEGKDNIPAGHLNGPARDSVEIDFDFPNGIGGCHSVTLAVSHKFDNVSSPRAKPVDPGDVATATWWFDLEGDPSRPDLLASCVVRGTPTGDAGIDGDAGAP